MMTRQRRTRILFSSVATVAVLLTCVIAPSVRAQAVAGVSTTVADIPRTASAIKDTIWEAILKAGRVSFLNVLRSAVNQFAYDTATYVGSGGEGQKPVYFTKQFGQWIREQGLNAGGSFVEEFVKTQQTDPDALLSKFDICAPDLSATVRISLGLTDFINESRGIPESRCNLKKVFDAASDQVDLITSPDYLRNLGLTAFSPETTDIGIAFTLFGGVIDEQVKIKEEKTLERQESEGWIDPASPISAQPSAPPGTNKAKLAQVQQLQTQSFFTQTGDIFVDAANIFLNQLALSAFNKLIDSLSKDSGSNSSNNFYAQNQQGGGVAEISRRANKLLQAKFTDKTDYNILNELASCPDENKPGPTNCVITQQFAQAINQHLTIAQAIEQDILDPHKQIGFDRQGNNLNYREGYPYRSLIILRKYRILPVGWEVAAQYVKDNHTEITLGDMIGCFDLHDSYPNPKSVQTDWCQGLIDPNWVLKVPKQYCGIQGYGGEILNLFASPDQKGYCMTTDKNCQNSPAECQGNTNNQTCEVSEDCTEAPYTVCNKTYSRNVEVVRNENYCADEQSCIKENPNGSCAFYGYCTEEKRLWTFGQNQENRCDARNNTCQTFQSEGGQTVSYLQNTLNYKDCNANQVGCKQYATQGTYNTTTKQVGWTTTGSSYFNKNIADCEASGEGCHQFIRAKEDLDTNLIADGSFEGITCVSNGGVESSLPSEQKNASNPFVPSASAQAEIGECVLTNFPSSGYLPNSNNHWYIRTNGGTVRAGIINGTSDQGNQSLYIEGNGGIYSKDASAPTSLPEGFTMEGGRYYSVSARVFVTGGKVRIGFGDQAGQYVESTANNAWQSLVFQYYNPTTAPAHEFFIQGVDGAAKFYVDSVKFSAGRAATSYSAYLSNNVIYQKLLPSYLENVCYENVGTPTRGDAGEATGTTGADYRLKANAPAECYNFARKCNATEVGCESFTALNSNIQVTAKAKLTDSCSGSCVGYDTFVRQENSFNAKASAYFIPKTARSCSAQSVGCTAFTNLDKVGQGGEAVEYYTEMRSCMKPDTAQCGEFYTWEGSDEAGYQLRVFSLKRSASGREEPASTLSPEAEAQLCSGEIFKRLPSQPGYNYDCREFYGRDGTVSYHLYNKTISCSDECHPYRREVASAADCTAGGGQWDSTQNRCLYYAIPGEGTSCSAQEVGCQEYTGNIASNVQTVLNDTFEDNSNPRNDWAGGSQSNTALQLGGHSLLGSNISKIVGERVVRNRSYTISFLAKAASAGTLINSLSLSNNAGTKSDFATASATIKNEWQLYTFNLSELNHDVSPKAATSGEPIEQGDAGPIGGFTGETLNIAFSGTVYIDNIRLTEVPNRYYLIENSWNTPAECDEDAFGNSAPRYMLGCSQYRKTDNSTVNLRSFSELCQDSAAGCEAMVDTKNSADYRKKLVNDTNNNGQCDAGETSCVTTPADTMINVAFDPSKQCGSDQKSCQRVGLVSTYNNRPTYSDLYIKNDPDQYPSIVCSAAGVGCSQYGDGRGGTYYFKDPGEQVCEWRLRKGQTNSYAWLQKQVKHCGGVAGGAICTDAGQCAANQQCTLVEEDIDCPTTFEKTLGQGGIGNRASQPSQWAGSCEAAQSGCTEYVDPVSKINSNLVKNPTYIVSGSGANQYDPWKPVSNSCDGSSPTCEVYQNIDLDLHTLYILKGDNNASLSAYIKCSVPSGTSMSLYELDSATNTFKKNAVATSRATGGAESLQFYLATTGNSQTATCELHRRIPRPLASDNGSVELRKAIVEYQLAQNLDTTSANGLVSFNRGYVLFNQRSQNGSAVKPLIYNADQTIDGEDSVDGTQPQAGSPANANTIIKVQSDRVCSKWLSCNASVSDPANPGRQTCLDIGLCDALDNEGKCSHPITPSTTQNQNISSLADISNLTGYSKVGYRKSVNSIEDNVTLIEARMMTDYYNFANMKQGGEEINLSNEGFEASGGWSANPADGFKIMLQPQELQQEQLNSLHTVNNPTSKDAGSYLPPVGRGVARLNPTAKASQSVSLSRNKTYVISAYLYVKTGNETANAGIRLTGGSGVKPLLSTATVTTNSWYRQTVAFQVSNDGNYNLELFNETASHAYFDDIRVEVGLNVRCSDRDVASGNCGINGGQITNPEKREYVLSSCRLYPTNNALDCSYTDNNGVTSQGIRGYCLEPDPQNPGVCLLWYPLDKIASEKSTELPPVTFDNKNVYYCLEAASQCSANEPEFFCKSFVKVDTSTYWYSRLNTTEFKMPNPPAFGDTPMFVTPASDRKIDFGGGPNRPVVSIPSITANMSNGFFGSWLTGDTPGSEQKKVQVSNNTITSFLPYYGPPSGTKCSAAGPYAGGIRSVPDTYFLGNSDEDTTQEMILPGEWDVCATTISARVDFNTGNCGEGANCKAGNISAEHNVRGCGDTETSCKADDGSQCSVENVGGRIWKAKNGDYDYNDDESACAYYCYNRQGSYKVTTSTEQAKQAVMRLFPGSRYTGSATTELVWPYYTWDPNSNTYVVGSVSKPVMTQCRDSNGNVTTTRQAYKGTLDDYCYIQPKITDFKIDNSTGPLTVNGEKTLDFTFNTATDKEQLPIKEIILDLGYTDEGGTNKTIPIVRNAADVNPRLVKQLIQYSDIDTVGNSSICGSANGPAGFTEVQCGPTPCCAIKPKIRMTDNWGYFSEQPYSNYIRVSQSSEG